MDKTSAPSKPEQAAPFYSKTVEGQTFQFRRPGDDAIDRFMVKAGRGPVGAAREFTRKLVTADSEAAWHERIQSEPGLMTEVAQEILERLGFR